MPKPDKNDYDEKEAERRFQQTLRGALATPHKAHAEKAKPKKPAQKK